MNLGSYFPLTYWGLEVEPGGSFPMGIDFSLKKWSLIGLARETSLKSLLENALILSEQN